MPALADYAVGMRKLSNPTEKETVATRESLKDIRVSIVLWTIGIVVVAVAALGGYINYLNNMGNHNDIVGGFQNLGLIF